MKIVPFRIDFNTLYENRHLFTDDVKYNSLIISNVFNLNINLISKEDYDILDHTYKKQIYDANANRSSYNYILSKHGVYIQNGGICSYDLVIYRWRFLDKKYNLSFTDKLFNILTIV